MPRLKTLPARLGTTPNRLATVNPESWRQGKTSTGRGYGYRWQQAREQYLAKHPLCVMCQGEGRTEAATTVDHITPHRGDMTLFWDRTNWQSLCTTHHSAHKQRLEAAGLAG